MQIVTLQQVGGEIAQRIQTGSLLRSPLAGQLGQLPVAELGFVAGGDDHLEPQAVGLVDQRLAARQRADQRRLDHQRLQLRERLPLRLAAQQLVQCHRHTGVAGDGADIFQAGAGILDVFDIPRGQVAHEGPGFLPCPAAVGIQHQLDLGSKPAQFADHRHLVTHRVTRHLELGLRRIVIQPVTPAPDHLIRGAEQQDIRRMGGLEFFRPLPAGTVEAKLYRRQLGFEVSPLLHAFQAQKRLGLGLIQCLLGEAGQRCYLAPAPLPVQQQPIAAGQLLIVKTDRLAQRQRVTVQFDVHGHRAIRDYG